MSGGWVDSGRKARLPDDWPVRRKAVLERCGGRCEVIKKDGRRCWDRATEVDHIIAGDNHEISALQGICTWHHRRKSSREGNDAQAAQRAMLRHPIEQHPGVITGPPKPPKYKGF